MFSEQVVCVDAKADESICLSLMHIKQFHKEKLKVSNGKFD